MKIGDKFWCVLPTLEAKACGEAGPREPWLGVIARDQGNGLFTLCQFNPTTNEPDLDDNASALVFESDVFLTELEAVGAELEVLREIYSSTQNRINRAIKRESALAFKKSNPAEPS